MQSLMGTSCSSICATEGSPSPSAAASPKRLARGLFIRTQGLQQVSKSHSALNFRQRQQLGLYQSSDPESYDMQDSSSEDSPEVSVIVTVPSVSKSSSCKTFSTSDSDKVASSNTTATSMASQLAGQPLSPPGNLRSRRAALVSRSMIQLTDARDARDVAHYSNEKEIYLRSIDSPKAHSLRAADSPKAATFRSVDSPKFKLDSPQLQQKNDSCKSTRINPLFSIDVEKDSKDSTAVDLARSSQQLQQLSEVHGGSSMALRQQEYEEMVIESADEADGTTVIKPLASLLPPPKWAAPKPTSRRTLATSGLNSSSYSSSSTTCSTPTSQVMSPTAAYKPRPPACNSSSPKKARPGLHLKHLQSSAAVLPPPNTPTAAVAATLAAAVAAGKVLPQMPAVTPLLDALTDSNTNSSRSVQHVLQEKQRVYEKAAVAAAAQTGVVATLCEPIAIARHCPADLDADIWQPRDFVQTRKLYEGKIAVVVQGYHASSGRPLALKVYNRAKLDVMERFQLAREVCLHMRCCHPYIAALYAAYKDNRHIYLLMELAPQGNLYQMLMAMQVPQGQARRLPEREAVVKVIRPLLSSLNYLHEQGIIHRDIKLENVLLAEDGSIKLADFGLSIDTQHEPANTRLGTQGYFAPEVLALPLKASPFEGKSPAEAASRPSYNCKADVWSAGVVCYEVLTGRAPFAADSPASVLKAILHRTLVYPSHLSPQAVSFLQAALTRDPAARATSRQLLQHEFIRMYHHNVTM